MKIRAGDEDRERHTRSPATGALAIRRAQHTVRSPTRGIWRHAGAALIEDRLDPASALDRGWQVGEGRHERHEGLESRTGGT